MTRSWHRRVSELSEPPPFCLFRRRVSVPDEPMIRDGRVLQDDFIPKEVKHRDPEVNRISDALAPITDGESGETTFLFGPSGVGKTCLAQFVTERLREQVLDLDTCYVNCWEDYNRYRTLYRVLDGVASTHDINR